MLKTQLQQIKESLYDIRIGSGGIPPKEAFFLIKRFPSKFMLALCKEGKESKTVKPYFLRYCDTHHIEERKYNLSGEGGYWTFELSTISLEDFYKKKYVCYLEVPSDLDKDGSICRLFAYIPVIDRTHLNSKLLTLCL